MRAKIKQTVTRWVSCEVYPEEFDPEMKGEELEAYSKELLYDFINEDGWDGEDILEESYEIEE